MPMAWLPPSPDSRGAIRERTKAVHANRKPPTIPVKPPPPGAVEAPGYIAEVFEGAAWLTADGQATDQWSERGVWPTPEAAAAAIEAAFAGKESLRFPGHGHTATPEAGAAPASVKPQEPPPGPARPSPLVQRFVGERLPPEQLACFEASIAHDRALLARRDWLALDKRREPAIRRRLLVTEFRVAQARRQASLDLAPGAGGLPEPDTDPAPKV